MSVLSAAVRCCWQLRCIESHAHFLSLSLQISTHHHSASLYVPSPRSTHPVMHASQFDIIPICKQCIAYGHCQPPWAAPAHDLAFTHFGCPLLGTSKSYPSGGSRAATCTSCWQAVKKGTPALCPSAHLHGASQYFKPCNTGHPHDLAHLHTSCTPPARCPRW